MAITGSGYACEASVVGAAIVLSPHHRIESDMVSRQSLNPTTAGLVAPIVCIECGNNAHCVRREADKQDFHREHRTFQCTTCRRLSYRVVDLSPSDAAIQKEAEQMAGRCRGTVVK